MRTLSLTLITCLLALPVSGKYSGGSGTAQDPYQIATAADLIVLGETPADYEKHFVLTADLDLDPNLPGGRVFDKAVIAPDANDATSGFEGSLFIGGFDGAGHTISHLMIRGVGYLGLFGRLGSEAQVRALGLVDVNVIGSGICVGGFVGENRGNVTECYSTGSVTGSGLVGGLIGYNNGGALTRCYSAGEISGTDSVAGLVGGNGWVSCRPSCGYRSGMIYECYSLANVLGTGTNSGGLVGNNTCGDLRHCHSTGSVRGTRVVGGLVGYNNWAAHVTQCYSAGPVSGTKDTGGLAGSGYAEGVTACFWNTETSGQAKSAGGTGLTTAEMQDMQTYRDAGWDFAGEAKDGLHEIWQVPSGGGYPILAIFNGYVPPRLQGIGTPGDPYVISNASELGAMVYYSAGDYYRLAASIDLSGTRWGMSVIPSFAGTFDGNGHTISHLTIRGGSYLGLFGWLLSGAEVRNLGVVDVNVVGSGDFVGALAGGNGNLTWNLGGGMIAGCYSTGVISGDGLVGGLVGGNWGHVTQSYSTAEVSGESDVGGLVGLNEDGTVTLCYSTGAVSGTGSMVGGLVGQNSDTVTHCYSTATVRGDRSIGGLVGQNGSDPPGEGGGISGTISHCYSAGRVSGNGQIGGLVGFNFIGSVASSFWDGQTSGQAESAGGERKTTTQMLDIRTYLEAGWDFLGEIENGLHETWQMPPKGGCPVLAILSGYTPPKLPGTGMHEDPYVVSDVFGLGAMVYYSPDAYYRLESSMDLEGIRWGTVVIPWFSGTFDGNGHTISQVTIKAVGYVGLFGRLEGGAEVRDLAVTDVNITGSDRAVGALAGYNDGVVVGCRSIGVVKFAGTAYWGWNTGGLVGYNGYSGAMSQCHSSGAVTGYEDVGGLVGRNNGNLAGCNSASTVSGTYSYIGGLVGHNSSYVTQCYSKGPVAGGSSVGGLVGWNTGDVTECQSSGTVTGYSVVGGLVGRNDNYARVTDCYSVGAPSGKSHVGGLVGYNQDADVTQCYSTGSVTGSGGVGGLVGHNSYNTTVTACFWDTETSGQTTWSSGSGKTTAEMQTARTFLDAGWDFVGETKNGAEDIWWILEGKDYPRLWWEARN
jgi:hypothetical protein